MAARRSLLAARRSARVGFLGLVDADASVVVAGVVAGVVAVVAVVVAVVAVAAEDGVVVAVATAVVVVAGAGGGTPPGAVKVTCDAIMDKGLFLGKPRLFQHTIVLAFNAPVL